MSCGRPLGDGAPAAAPPAPRSSSPPEERRTVTVLFADLAGYTAVAERMDPERVKAVVEPCLRRLGDEVERFGGTIDKFIGDNVMALFGAPVAYEDDPERAVRAALGMQAAMDGINAMLSEIDAISFDLRVGINTGEVMAGAVGERYTVTGDTVNVASRLQSAGRPGAVTVGERTRAATLDVVDYDELPALTLKGKAQPVPAWEAIALREASTGGGLATTPMVGRAAELEMLRSLVVRVTQERRCQFVTVAGQAGVGKTRLLEELIGGVRESDLAAVLHGRCLPYGANVAYWALGEVVRADAGIVASDPAQVAWEKLSGRYTALAPDEDPTVVARRAALVARLVGIEVPVAAADVEGAGTEQARDSLFAAVRAGIEARTARESLVLVFEDIHWADDGMLDLIEYLSLWVRGPLLILCLTRDDLLERRRDWGGGRRAGTTLLLEPLTDEQTRTLVTSLVGDDAGGSDLIALVCERAGGNPFFAQEMARRLVESGEHVAGALPDTVQALLAARIDSLERAERRLVQQAAVAGSEFWISSLIGTAHEEGCDLESALRSLEEKGIIEPVASRRLAGERVYAFRHVLIRDVAYSMLPKAVRAQKHYEVGLFVEERAGDRTDEVVGLLAEHFGRAAALAGETGLAPQRLEPIERKALAVLESAGDAAALLFSNAEAYTHLRNARGLRRVADDEASARLGEKQADVAARIGHIDDALELWEECLEFQRAAANLGKVGDLHRKIGGGLWHKGEGRQAIEHYQRGINLLKDEPARLELVRLYEEAAWLYMNTGDNMLAIYAAEKALRLAERLGETSAACRAHGIFGRVFGRIGDSAKAREHLERSVELARGTDEGETIRALATLGDHLEISEADYTAARAAYDEALGIAERVGDVPAQLELQAALAILAVYRADWLDVDRRLEISGRLAEDEGLAGKMALPATLRGLICWRDGDFVAAERQFTTARDLAAQVGWSEVSFDALFGLALSLRDRGEFTAVADVLSESLEVCERAGLVAQSIQAIAQRAIVLKLAGRDENAREAASEAMELAARLHYPVGKAAACEAAGFTAGSAQDGAKLLREARAIWGELGRPLEAARCDLLSGRVLLRYDREAALVALEASARTYEDSGVPRLATLARSLAGQAGDPT